MQESFFEDDEGVYQVSTYGEIKSLERRWPLISRSGKMTKRKYKGNGLLKRSIYYKNEKEISNRIDSGINIPEYVEYNYKNVSNESFSQRFEKLRNYK